MSFPALCSSSPNAGGQYADYTPWDLECAYNLQTVATAGRGQVVAIVDAYDDARAESDLATYRSSFGMPPCTTANGCFRKVNQMGQSTAYPSADPTGGWAAEESLDLDMASAACPNCSLLLVEANSNYLSDLETAENEAAALGAVAISNSWGLPESNMSQPTDTDRRAFDHPGTEITVSAGDSGYGVMFPAALATVTAVGGTSLFLDAAGHASRPWSTSTLGWDEAAWSAGGSGCSQYEPKPSWQTDLGCPLNRTVADVALDADPNTGVQVYDSMPINGQTGPWWWAGGTSIGAPFIAGVYALAGNAATAGNGFSYGHAAALYDITSGSNGSCLVLYQCTAGPGYDGPTGLGTPNGTGGF